MSRLIDEIREARREVQNARREAIMARREASEARREALLARNALEKLSEVSLYDSGADLAHQGGMKKIFSRKESKATSTRRSKSMSRKYAKNAGFSRRSAAAPRNASRVASYVERFILSNSR